MTSFRSVKYWLLVAYRLRNSKIALAQSVTSEVTDSQKHEEMARRQRELAIQSQQELGLFPAH